MEHVLHPLGGLFKGHGITDQVKRTLLVFLLSANVVRILQGRCQSAAVNSLTYEAIADYLEEYYSHRANEVAASYSFFSRKQEGGENVQDFIANLLHLAEGLQSW